MTAARASTEITVGRNLRMGTPSLWPDHARIAAHGSYVSTLREGMERVAPPALSRTDELARVKRRSNYTPAL
jgi:hypothetical protein